MVPTDDGASAAPIDRAVLEHMRSRFAGRRVRGASRASASTSERGGTTREQFESATISEEGKVHLRVELSGDYYPTEASARVEIRWYRNDDFTVHYQEDRRDSAWTCRWDRHPNAHNSRDHFHPPPIASRTDAENAHWPDDHRDVCRLVLDRLEERIETLWEQR